MSEDHIGKRIKRYRGTMSAEELAQRIDNDRITRSVIANIESGRKPDPTIAQLLDIAHALRVPLAVLVADVENPFGPTSLPQAGETVRNLTNLDLMLGLMSSDIDEEEHPKLEAIVQGLHALRDLDSEIDMGKFGIEDLEAELTDDDTLVGTARGMKEDSLANMREELQRNIDTREATLSMLRALGVKVTP